MLRVPFALSFGLAFIRKSGPSGEAGSDAVAQQWALCASMGGAYFPIRSWPGARSRGGRVAKPVVPEGISPLAVLVSTRSNVVTNAAKATTMTAIANNRITGSGFRSVLMSNSTQTLGS